MGTVGKGRRMKRLFKQINQDLAQKNCTQKKSAMANSGETSTDEMRLYAHHKAICTCIIIVMLYVAIFMQVEFGN